MSERATLLVTGGSGFIGSQLVKMALDKGYRVVNLDIKAPTSEEQKRVWQNVDMRDATAVLKAVQSARPSHMIHLASDIDVTYKNIEDYKTTIAGTSHILAAASKISALKRFVHVSTQYVVRPGVEAKSDTDYIPYTVYGAAKAETEKLVHASGLGSYVIARPTIIWGPGHPSFADQIFRRMAQGTYRHPATHKPLMRGYGYVSNTARQMLVLIESDADILSRKVYYLGDGQLDYDQWADAFCKRLTGRKAKRIPAAGLYFLGLIGSSMRRLGLPAPYDLGRYFRMTTSAPIDFSPILALAGPSPVTFEQGVEASVAWLEQIRPEIYAR